MNGVALLAMIWRPYYSLLSLIGGAVVLGALAAFVYARSFATHPVLSVNMFIMRLALISAVMVLLMGPSVVPPVTSQPGRPCLTLMLDTSASMLTRDVDGQSRYDFAVSKWLSADTLDRLNSEFQVELIGFDESPRRVTAESLRRPGDEVAVARVSNVFESVRESIAGLAGRDEGAAVVVISDGRDTQDDAVAPVAQLAAAQSVPVHTVPLGAFTLQRDVALAVLPLQQYLFAGEPGQIIVKVLQTNADELATDLHVRCRGESAFSQRVSFRSQSVVTFTVPIEQDEPGLYEYEVEIDPAPGEVETANNRQSLFMEVTAARMRVLVLEGEPFWDTKFLAQSLRMDERIELTQISQLAPKRQEKIVSRSASGQARLPQTLEDLSAYDVIILGRGIEHVLSPDTARLLRRYVGDQGGRIVFARGQAYDPHTAKGQRIAEALAVLEPVDWGVGVLHDQKLTLAPAGRMHPSFAFSSDLTGGNVDQLLDDLPGLALIPIVGREKPAARVLALARGAGEARAADGQPALIVMRYDRGVVITLLGEGLWRWSLLPEQAKHLQGVFDQFWSNMVRWLAMGSDYQPGKKLAVRLSQHIVQLGDAVTIDVSTRFGGDEQIEPRLTITGPDGQRHEPALRRVGEDSSRRHAQFTPDTPGLHTVVVDSPALDGESVQAKFTVHDIDFERLLSASNRPAMRRLAVQSGGLVLDPHKPQKLIEVLRRYRASTIVPPQPKYVWDQGWILTLILVWAGLEWLIRKSGGLL